ncbi:MAG: TrbI/VirB10 family protein [Devosia sp.]
MSEITENEKPASPDFFVKPTGGNGGKCLHKYRLLYVVAGIAFLALSALVVAAYVRDQNMHASLAEAEIPRVSSAAVPPIKRPDGPDVNFPADNPPTGYGYPSEVSPVKEDEVLKQARVRRAEVLHAALSAPPNVDGFIVKAQQGVPGHSFGPGVPDSRGIMPPPPPPQGYGDEYGEGVGEGDINNQESKRAFFKKSMDSGHYLAKTREIPLSSTQLNAGSIIPGVMISGVNSDLPGLIIGQVRQDVFASAAGSENVLLIPAGAKLVGSYDSSVSAGQERVLVAWNRVIFPDGSSLSLDSMPGADRSGFAGFNDKVDNHYARTFGTAFMLSLFSAATQLSQPRAAVGGTYNSQQIMAAALGQQLGMLGMQTARRNLMIQPTLEISPGYQFSIMVTKDIVLPPYVAAGGY